MQQIPKPFRAHLGERVLDLHGSAQPQHILGGVVAGDSVPARIALPLALKRVRIA